MKKIQVAFQQAQFDSQLESLNTNLNKIKKCQDSIFKITGKGELTSLDEVEEFITTKTTFANVLLSANLLNVASEYQYLKDNLNGLNLDFIDFKDNVPFVKDDAIERIKIANTIYLKDELIAEYELLVKAGEILNKLSNPTYINSLSRDYQGKYSVNLLALNNSTSR